MLTSQQLLDGLVIPIDKPRQWTSFQAVNKVKSAIRRLYDLKKFKIGHAGTLDPLASGLLLVCVGKATKQIEQLQQGTKTYTGTIVLGATTPSFDLERPIDCYYNTKGLTIDAIKETIRQLTGEIEQVPPMFSAVKVDGVRAYQYARVDAGDKGHEENIIQPKRVIVYSFDITDYRPGRCDFAPPPIADTSHLPKTQLYKAPAGELPEGLPQIDFSIRCGKGTYIRSLARDLGVRLGTGGLLSALRRESIGDYHVDTACKIDQIDEYLCRLTAPQSNDIRE
ncbi:MAG: tRNA pseudouridine(55) synthase TruB [Bacteroidales bacterium]|nr:tRNA pseudouridine(55) synthase TruB [Bacteroidales bacterium]